MSEVQSRPVAPRGGRGSGRGGRGGFAGRGGSRQQTRPSATNGDTKHDSAATDSLANIDDDGEMGELKKLYGSKVESIKIIFADWTDVDILFALRECNGDADQAVSRIAEGSISQWGEVSKKERTKTKAKGESFTTTTGEPAPAGNMRPARGGRGDGARGRGRATERGGRASRAKPAQATNGTRVQKTEELSVPTEESTAWAAAKTDANAGGAWDDSAAPDTAAQATDSATTTTAPAVQKTSIIPEGSQKTWASMLRQTAVPKPAPKPKEAPPKPPAESTEATPVAELSAEPASPAEEFTQDAAEPDELADTPEVPSTAEIPVVVPEIALPPSKDLLTETNLEQVHDESQPPPTETARSEATDSWDPRAANTAATPLSASQHQHQGLKAPASGYAATAAKATDRQATRTPSYTRRVLEQTEAVHMPKNPNVDSATVQFGALNFSGVDDDIDGDREEPETRAQPPDDSPVAHPRTSLPPVPQPAQVPQAYPAQQKPTTSLPPVSAPTSMAAPESSPWGATTNSRPAAPTAPAAQQQTAGTPQAQPSAPTAHSYGRFGPSAGQEQGFGQKPFDGFNQTNPAAATQSQYDAFQSQQPTSQAPIHQGAGAFSSAPNDYSSYYTADQQNRTPYSYYNQQGYGQQQTGQGQGQQDGAATTQHRSVSGYNTNPPNNDNLNQYPQSGASRFAGATTASDAQNSGSNTPNPPAHGQQGSQAGSQQQQGLQQQQPHGSQYPFNHNHPYYQNPYYSQYMNQYQGYGQGGYGGGPYGKGGFGQQQPYGMSPGAPYDHSSSQSSGFGQSHRGESSLTSGLGDYGSRTGGGQQSGGQQGLGGGGGFGGGMHDSFARGGSSYQTQSGQGFNAQSQAGATPSAADDLKPFGDSKGAGGPSPSIGGARPGSATNTAASQSGLPPPQSTQQSGMGMGGYGGYPGHLQQGHGLHGGQSGSGGFAGGNQGHGNPSYGGYGNQAYNNYYGGNQPRGWGGNYH